MFIILPYRHEVALRRLPVATIGLIVITSLAFLVTHFIIQGEINRYNESIEKLAEDGAYLFMDSESTDGDPFGFLWSLPDFQKLKTPDEICAYIANKLRAKESNKKIEKWLLNYDNMQSRKDNMLIMKVGFVPANQPSVGLILHMFVHAGWIHIIFNMWFLFLAGQALEDYWGRFTFLGLYLIGGIAAAMLQWFFHPSSVVPMVGASGAVAAAMGAFAIRFGGKQIECAFVGLLVFRPVFRLFSAPAWLLLAAWFLVQIFWALMYHGIGEEASVGFWAHIGGFAFGAAVASLFKYGKVEAKVIQPAMEKIPELQSYEANPEVVAAMDLMGRQMYKEALAKISTFIEISPHNLDAQLIKANLLFFLARHEESIALFHEIIDTARGRADRDHLTMIHSEFRATYPAEKLPPDLKLAVGRAWLDKGDADRADRIFSVLAESCDDENIKARALFYSARVRAELRGNTDGARAYLDQFLANHRNHPWAERAHQMLDKLQDSE